MKNPIGRLMNVIGSIIIGVGVIGGIITWIIIAANINGMIGFGVFAAALTIFVFLGMVLIGLGEIISLLQDIKDSKSERNGKNNTYVKTKPNKISKANHVEGSEDDFKDFECPYCGEIISASKSDLGNGKLKCPYCDNTLYIYN